MWPARGRAQRDLARPRRVAHGVLDEVHDDLVDALGVARGLQPGGRVDREDDVLGRVQARLARGALEHVADGERADVERLVAGLQPREVEQLGDEPAEPARLREHRRSVSGSGSLTPSTTFSSTACSAPIGVRSSCETFATRSRRRRSVSASSAVMRLNARASSPTSSLDVTATWRPCSPRAIALATAAISRSGFVVPRASSCTHASASAIPAPAPTIDGRPRHAHADDRRHRRDPDRRDDDDAELELQRGERPQRLMAAAASRTRSRSPWTVRMTSAPSLRRTAATCESTVRPPVRAVGVAPDLLEQLLAAEDDARPRASRCTRSNSVGVRCTSRRRGGSRGARDRS